MILYNRIKLVCLSLSFAGIISGKALLFQAYGQPAGPERPVKVGPSGGLVYQEDSAGNRMPDFSYAGYRAGAEALPNAAIKIRVPPLSGARDATAYIQAAIDYVAGLSPDATGVRGAVLLEKGVFRIDGTLRLANSGVVLRGSGATESGTVLLGAGTSRETLIQVAGVDNRVYGKARYEIASYAPVNATELIIDGTHGIQAGDRVTVHRPSTEEWIKAVGMERFGGDNTWLGWKPGHRDMAWDREVVAVQAGRIMLDAPITTAIDPSYGGGYVQVYDWPGRIKTVGVENLLCKSAYDIANPKDEAHRWVAIGIDHAVDVWVRQVTFEHFAGSAVFVNEAAKRITVEDCKALEPVSEIAAFRRRTFFTVGQQTLFQRLYAEYGYHDFAVGDGAAGPNVFVQCESHLPHNYSGTIGSWASGVLYDIVNVDGHALGFPNRGPEAQGAGWTAANSVIWQCAAARIDCFRPPGANNWAFGTWALYAGNGSWYESDTHIRPRSLYYAQLAGRFGEEVWDRSYLMPLDGEPSSSPTVDKAREMSAAAYSPAPQLEDWIDSASSSRGVTIIPSAGIMDAGALTLPDGVHIKPRGELRLDRGWLIVGDQLAVGRRHGVSWWRGGIRQGDVQQASPHITRFVPGRVGTGYTDNLEEVAAWMVAQNRIAIEHNYGLWYDRRRDDHQRVRRMDAEVWAPFYEQPFARSGKGTAWDGLSKYDLTTYNTWYWDRLNRFATLAYEKGLLLIHQHYFQHNILEAGAHYADFPWRTANNINDVGFPEPPNYAGDKRIFMDAQFYDVEHPVRREIHRSYIRKCLANFGDNPNVLHLIGAEYTGPLHFMQFWIDVIKEWEAETGTRPTIVLSATKDVQDAILADSERAGVVDVIDIRYWHYQNDGELYAPKGGVHLAPRQHARIQKTGKVSFASAYRAVVEYRKDFPDKAVIYSAGNVDQIGWAVLLAGGSLAQLPASASREFLDAAATMQPATLTGTDDVYALSDGRGGWIIYPGSTDARTAVTTRFRGKGEVRWIAMDTGTEITDGTKGKAVIWIIPN